MLGFKYSWTFGWVALGWRLVMPSITKFRRLFKITKVSSLPIWCTILQVIDIISPLRKWGRRRLNRLLLNLKWCEDVVSFSLVQLIVRPSVTTLSSSKREKISFWITALQQKWIAWNFRNYSMKFETDKNHCKWTRTGSKRFQWKLCQSKFDSKN